MFALVTGASGLVGTHLLSQLVRQNRKVRVLALPGTNTIFPPEVEVIYGDIRDTQVMRDACQGVRTVFHLAAMISISGGKNGKVWDVNVNGLSCVAQAALEAKVTRMVHVSSIHAYNLLEPSAEVITEDGPRVGQEHPIYDQSKWAGERELQKWIDKGLDGVIVNPTGIIGSLDHEPSRMGRFLQNVFQGKIWAMVPGGFDFVDVRDVVMGILAAETLGRTGENYILSGHWYTFTDIIDKVRELVGISNLAMIVPVWLAYLGIPLFALSGKWRGQEPLVTKESLFVLKAATRSISSLKAESELGYSVREPQDTLMDIYSDYLQHCQQLIKRPSSACLSS